MSPTPYPIPSLPPLGQATRPSQPLVLSFLVTFQSRAITAFCSQRLEKLYSTPSLPCPTQPGYLTSGPGTDTSFFKAPGWSQHRATLACGWEANGPFCGWLLGQRLRGEIRYPLPIDFAWNTTDKMFLNSAGQAGDMLGDQLPFLHTLAHWFYLHLRTQLGPV